MPEKRPRRPRDPNTTRVAAKLRRNLVLLLTWAVEAVLIFYFALAGPPVLLLPIVVVGAVVAVNTVMVVKEDSPERSALAPGRLREAEQARDEVAVAAWRLPRRGAPDRQRAPGTLSYAAGRLSFVASGVSPVRTPGSTATDPVLEGVLLLEARPVDCELGARPSWLRPALVVLHAGNTHVFELAPAWDVAGGVVGSVLSRAWWDQLVELGARPPA